MDFLLLGKIQWWVSVILLSSGVLFLWTRRKSKPGLLFSMYLVLILLLELLSRILLTLDADSINIYLFHFSGLMHYLFILHIFRKYLGLEQRIRYFLLLFFGLILFVINTGVYNDPAHFENYVNVGYNLLILSMSFSYFTRTVLRGERPERSAYVFNVALIVFFAFDSIIALSSNYLINEHIHLVAPFWALRTLLIQLFYFSIIHYSWQIGKTRA